MSVDISSRWISQYDQLRVPDAGPTACYRACREMARRGWGVEFPESTAMRIQVADAELDAGEIAPNVGGYTMAREFLRERLSRGLPVIVGIHYRPGSQNRDRITDHFNLLAGVDGQLLVGLNPGAELHGQAYNAAFIDDEAAHCWRAVLPRGLRASVSMVVPHRGWQP